MNYKHTRWQLSKVGCERLDRRFREASSQAPRAENKSSTPCSQSVLNRVLTSDVTYLDPYHVGLISAETRLRNLRTKTADNPDQQAVLELVGTELTSTISKIPLIKSESPRMVLPP